MDDRLIPIFENDLLGILRVDNHMVIENANQRSLRMFGYTPDEILQRNIGLLFDRVDAYQSFTRSCRQDTVKPLVKPYEYWLKKKDGNLVSCQVTFNAYRISPDSIGYYVTFLDNTTFKRNQQIISIQYQISNLANTMIDLDQFFSAVHQYIKPYVNTSNFYIALVNEDEEILEFNYFKDEFETNPSVVSDLHNPKNPSLSVKVINDGKPLLITRAEMEFLGVPGLGPKAACWLGIPLHIESTVIGVMVVQHYTDAKHFSQGDVEFLSSISEQVAWPVERHRLHFAIEIKDRIANAIAQLSLTASKCENLEQLFKAIVVLLGKTTHAEHLFLGLFKVDSDHTQFSMFMDETQKLESEFKIDGNLNISMPTQEIMRHELPLIIDRQSMLKASLKGKLKKPTGLKAMIWIGVPLILNNKVIGVIVAQDNDDPKHFSKIDLDILASVSGHIATTIKQKQDEEKDLTHKRLGEIMTHLSNSVGLFAGTDQVFKMVFDALSKFMGVNNFFIALIDEENDRFDFPFIVDEKDVTDQEIINISNPRIKSPLLQMIRSKRPLFKSKKPGDHANADSKQAQSAVWLGVPLKIGPKVIGGMVIHDYTNSHRFSTKDIPLMSSVSELVSICIDRKNTFMSLAKAQEEVSAAAQDKSDFLTGMGNEFKTPLENMQQTLDQVCERIADQELRKSIISVRDAGLRLKQLINDVLDLYTVNAGQLFLEEVEFNIHQSVREVCEGMAHKANAKKLDLICAIPSNVPLHVKGYPRRLQQILASLVDNAVTFTQKGKIKVSLEKLDPAEQTQADAESKEIIMIFKVKDTGIGIRKGVIEKLIKTVVPSTSFNSEGLGTKGLGLSVAKRLIQLMGGQMSIDSKLGKGTVVSFFLPFKFEPEKLTMAKDHFQTLEGLRILIADNHKANQIELDKMFGLWQAKPVFAASTKDTIALIEDGEQIKDRFDLIVLDSDRPLMDTFKILEKIKSTSGRFDHIILMIDQEEKFISFQKAKNLGVKFRIAKPAMPDNLRPAIEEILNIKLPAQMSDLDYDQDQEQDSFFPTTKPLKILLIEDIENHQTVFMLYLKKTPHQIDVAQNGQIGLKKYLSRQYDIIFMDLEMPVMDGYEAIKQIRKYEKENKLTPVPIIAMAEQATDGIESNAKKSGCQGFVIKPFDKTQLSDILCEFGGG